MTQLLIICVCVYNTVCVCVCACVCAFTNPLILKAIAVLYVYNVYITLKKKSVYSLCLESNVM